MLILKYLQLPFLFDAGLLLEEVSALSASTWKKHYQALHYQGEWSAIPLRSVNGIADHIIISPLPDVEYKNTFYLDRSPYLQNVLQSFKCPLKAVRLLKLNTGAIIKEHRDIGLNSEAGEIRLHIPVITHNDVEFYLDKERIHLKEGECWYMNFNLVHNITNNSPVDRIHLVIDAEVNDWVKELFAKTPITMKKEIEDLSDTYDTETKKQMIRQFREMNTETANRLADELEKQLL